VNGPLQILRQLWTKEQTDPVTRTTYQYVVDLGTAYKRHGTWHTTNYTETVMPEAPVRLPCEERTIKRTDQVLILLPTSDNKFLMQWRGPLEVLDRIEVHDYLI